MIGFRKFITSTCSHTRAVIASQPQYANLSQSAPMPSVDKATLSKLRKKTGFAFSNCRKALVLHDNDFDKALEWLNMEAAKEGWAKATRLQNRPMSQGVIGLITNSIGALMLEVNCETDFVARNLTFLELVSQVSHDCFNVMKTCKDEKRMVGTEELGSLLNASNESIADSVAKQVASIGENLKASRAVYMPLGDNSYIAHYLHTAGLNQKCLEIEGCQFGKYSALARLTGDLEQPELQLYATQLSQHIVGLNPQSIGVIDVSDEVSEQGSEATPVATSGEDTEDCEKGPKEESRLLFQEFLLDSELTTNQWLEQREISVADFVRFSVGEEAP